MTDRKFTLLELHLHGDTSFSPSMTNTAPAIGGSQGEETEGDSVADDEEAATATDDSEPERSRPDKLVLLGAFVLLVLVAGVAKALRCDDELDELDSLDDLAE